MCVLVHLQVPKICVTLSEYSTNLLWNFQILAIMINISVSAVLLVASKHMIITWPKIFFLLTTEKNGKHV